MINCGCIKTTSSSFSLYGRVLVTSAAATGSRVQYTQMWGSDGKAVGAPNSNEAVGGAGLHWAPCFLRCVSSLSTYVHVCEGVRGRARVPVEGLLASQACNFCFCIVNRGLLLYSISRLMCMAPHNHANNYETEVPISRRVRRRLAIER
jgi:hypothetical protein